MPTPTTTDAKSDGKVAGTPARPVRAWARWLGWMAHGFKLVCIMGIVWFGWQAIVGMRTLMSPTVDPQLMADKETVANGMPSPPAIAAAGNWVVGETDGTGKAKVAGMEYGGVRVAAADLEGYFSAAQEAGTTKVSPAASARLAALLPMAKQLNAEPIVRGARRIYRAEQERNRWQIVSEITPTGEQAINALFAARGDGDTWSIFQITGQEQSAENVPPLLPLPTAARFAWGRKYQTGGWMMQSFEIAAPLSELSSAWKSAGWQIGPLGHDSAGEGAIASRGNTEIYAWVASPAAGTPRMLLLLSLAEAAR